MTIRKKAHPLKSSVSQREASSSKDALSRISARKKSKSVNDSELRIMTPRNIDWLAQSGLIVPDDLNPGEETVPLDFTNLTDRAVGALHSRFAVRHSHALYVRATFATEMLGLKRRNRIAQATFRVRSNSDYKTEKALTDAFLLSKVGANLDKRMGELEIRIELTDAVLGGFEDVVKAASREMTRRDSERAPHD